ncbi:acyloxyacyl hydrolase [Roseisalinus antarcticus]|uniref:Lipid A 3-O-deacylase (PagL) n=1 Tax=Roseisalinus antarcticus TaxID=254357 RepID=A0A1Y5RGJ4_9RHOB|nr:acyloxyacyl hydrolase [Roseisalinus antarcticus]SLN16111.1 Lipid A 3-O-deacylase (PagL) [Roseisalinus antarcticus]
MDGTIATLFIIAGLTDMGLNHCPTTGCLAENFATPRLAFQTSAVEYQTDQVAREISLNYALDRKYGPFQPVVGLSATDDHSAWIGFGVRSDFPVFDTGFVVEGSLMPGYYAAGDGPELGGNLHFRGALGVSYEFANRMRLGLYYDHRSNADTRDENPGLETYGLRVSIPLR